MHEQVGTSGTRRPLVAVLLGNGHGGDNLRVGIVRVEGQRISSTDFQRNGLARRYRLEHVHHIVVGVAQNALIHHVHQNVAWIFIKSNRNRKFPKDKKMKHNTFLNVM